MGQDPELESAARHGSNDSSIVDRDEDAHLSLWQALSKYRRIALYSLGVSFAILMWGYDFAIVGTIFGMPSFQRDFGQNYQGKWILPSMWLALWDFIGPGMAMVGAVTAGFFQDWVGRRSSLFVGSACCAGSIAVCYVSNQPDGIIARRGVFLAGKGFQGFAVGMVTTTAQTYLSEILPPILRAPILAVFPIFALVGQLIGAAVIFANLKTENGYILCFASLWPFCAIPLVMSFVMPESPTYLVRKNKVAQALKSETRLSPPGADNRQAIDAIQRNIDHERRFAQATYMDCFRGINLRRTLIVMFANILPQIFGLSLLGKASYFMQVVGLDANHSLIMLIVGVVLGLVANVVSMWIMSRVGRRKLVLLSLPTLAVLWLSTGIAGCFKGTVMVWYTTVTLIVITVISGLSVWPVSYAIGGETSAMHLRSKAQGVGWLTSGGGNAVFGIALPYIFNPDEGNLRGKTGFIYAVFCAIAAVVAFFFVPELKGRTASEINRMFEQRLDARDFEKWYDGSDSSCLRKRTTTQDQEKI